MKTKISLAVVDDHQLFRKGMAALLSEIPDFVISFEAADGKELSAKLRNQKADVILLDIQMPVMDGVEATEHIRKRYPDCKVIILSMHCESELIYHLIQKGANGFLDKNADLELVEKAVRAVFTNGFYFDDRISKAMAHGIAKEELNKPKFNSSKLSDRELEVVKLIAKEYTIREIAESLCISPRTVDTYRENIFLKTGSKNIAGVVLYAMRHNIIH